MDSMLWDSSAACTRQRRLVPYGGRLVVYSQQLPICFESLHVLTANETSVCPAGVDVVFHCATAQLVGVNSKNENLMYSVNVTGTANVIDACVKHKVPRLVYTSTASVVFEGKSLVNVDETHPYATKPMDFYTSTKVGTQYIKLACCSYLCTCICN